MQITISIYWLIAIILVSGGLAHIILSALISARGSQEESSYILIEKLEKENENLRTELNVIEEKLCSYEKNSTKS